MNSAYWKQALDFLTLRPFELRYEIVVSVYIVCCSSRSDIIFVLALALNIKIKQTFFAE